MSCLLESGEATFHIGGLYNDTALSGFQAEVFRRLKTRLDTNSSVRVDILCLPLFSGNSSFASRYTHETDLLFGPRLCDVILNTQVKLRSLRGGYLFSFPTYSDSFSIIIPVSWIVNRYHRRGAAAEPTFLFAS